MRKSSRTITTRAYILWGVLALAYIVIASLGDIAGRIRI